MLISQQTPPETQNPSLYRYYYLHADGKRSSLPQYQAEGKDMGTCVFTTESGNGEGLGMKYTYIRAFIGSKKQIQTAFEGSNAASGKKAALQKLENCRRTIQQ
ncbi:MAG: hypothetical protein IPL65_11560 [Lewinellaceae bacterium]|nr:hypothetical protein [Lewinellaceae bacterium]